MAERRMFSKTIIDSDAFLDMSSSAQALYFHLAMRADDDGFINNPRKIQRMVGAADDDLKILVAKRFVIMFESGVIVIKHWRMHNYIRNDRYKATVYAEERNLLAIKDNGSYTLDVNQSSTNCLPSVNRLETQVRLGKDRVGKDSLGKGSSRAEGDGDIALICETALRSGLPWRPAHQDKANELVTEYGYDWLLKAIERVILRDRQNWGMVEGILHKWKEQGYVDEPGAKQTPPNAEQPQQWVQDMKEGDQ